MSSSGSDKIVATGHASLPHAGSSEIERPTGGLDLENRRHRSRPDTGNVSDASPPRRPRPQPGSRQLKTEASRPDQDGQDISDASPPRRRVRGREQSAHSTGVESRIRKRSRSIEGRRLLKETLGRHTSHSSATDEDLISIRSSAQRRASSSPRRRMVGKRHGLTRLPQTSSPHANRAPPNRYGIPPGPRWDGANRSNGFEVHLENMRSERKSANYQAYKASVADL